MKLKEVLDKTIAFFKDKKFYTPRLDAELLIAHGLKLERIQLYMKYDQPLNEAELATCRELVRRRITGEPVAYILGYRDFYGHRFEVNSATLIPRPETEHLVEEVSKFAKDKEHSWTVLDLGCGSGCIGLSVLMELPQAKLVAVDVSAKALEVARRNAESLGVSDRVQFIEADAGNADLVMDSFKKFMGQDALDILVSNPPYIADGDPGVEENVKKFEPNSALYAEENGLALLKAWSSSYVGYLNSAALVVMEMGLTQGSEMKTHFEKLGPFNEVRVIKDLSGHDRVIYGVKRG